MRALFIVNPASAGGRTGRGWERIERAARRRGIEVEARFTEAPGHARELARAALGEGRGLIVAVGGDGTVCEVVNGFFEDGRPLASEAELAVVSRGSGGDLVRSFAIPTRLERALDVVMQGRARRVDVGRARFTGADGGPAERLFLNIASAGMTAVAADRVNRAPKLLGGTAAYVAGAVAGFAAHRNRPVALELDGERRELVANSVVAANCRYFGGGMKITPGADPADGLLDVLVIADIGLVDLLWNLPRLYRGSHLPHPKLELLRGRRLRVRTAPGEQPFLVELDGEQPGRTPLEVDLLPSALALRVPAVR